jgi:hypothetical protein
MKANWKKRCEKIGHKEWADRWPDTGGYNCDPDESKFFR